MFQFNIADLVLNIESDNDQIIGYLGDFAVDQTPNANFLSIFKSCNSIDVPPGTIIGSDQITWMKKAAGQDGYYLYFEDNAPNSVLCLMDVNGQWDRAAISYLNYSNAISHNNQLNALYSHLLLGVLFRNHIIHHEGIVIHSSSLEWNGKGLVFPAPSGTGKSTHTRLWQEYFGSEVRILNDDTPAIRIRDGKPYIFGTPWSGSSANYYNRHAPLSAIVLLEQASKNTIRELSTEEAVFMMMPRVFLPYFDQNMMNMACNVFEKVVSSVPIYLLKCRPDREAVELVRQRVK